MKKKRLLSMFLIVVLVVSACFIPASAKSVSSVKAENVFFYAENGDGKSVLLKVMQLSDLKELAHGQANGDNYYISTTDNYPTTQYCEGIGFTVDELLNYVKSKTTVSGANTLRFSGSDTIALMATDSYGNYSRGWTYYELYGVKRYYFEGLYDASNGWKNGWEVAEEENSKFGLPLADYNASYAASDAYYADKLDVFKGGVESTVVLMTESNSGRTTSETFTGSTDLGIASYITANGGKVAGSLRDVLTDDCALRFSLPMTEADLMTAHRTAYDNLKWIYNLKLEMKDAPALSSQGTVTEPVPSFSLSGSTLTVSFSCASAGASIYYGDNGSPQKLYTGPFTIDVAGRDLDADPVTLYAAAVREGWDDAGVVTFKYPGMAPSFQTVYSGMAGSDLVFTAASGVSSADWTAWTGALNSVTMKSPSVNGYVSIDKSMHTINNTAKTITFDKSLFSDTGSYSFIFHATKYANKNVSVTMKKAAPTVHAAESYPFGEAVTLTFEDISYQSGLSIYVTEAEGKRTMISAGSLDRTQEGQVTIKPEYFGMSASIQSAGVFTFELSNNSYSPTSQTVTVKLGGFTDVPANAWFYSYVTDLANTGVVSGVGNNRFDPMGTLTWGQAMKLLMLTTGYEEQPAAEEHWAGGYMALAEADGLIANGLDPDAALTRLEFCQTAALALKLEQTTQASPFSDTDDPGVLALNQKGIINGIGGGLFSPDTTLTRAEISTIIWNIMNMEDENA